MHVIIILNGISSHFFAIIFRCACEYVCGRAHRKSMYLNERHNIRLPMLKKNHLTSFFLDSTSIFEAQEIFGLSKKSYFFV